MCLYPLADPVFKRALKGDNKMEESSTLAHKYCMVMTTIDGMDAARALAQRIVEARVGACVQLSTIESVYRWEGKICDEEEVLLKVKTRVDRFNALRDVILTHHPYDVPEIIMIPITNGNEAYLEWIAGEVRLIEE